MIRLLLLCSMVLAGGCTGESPRERPRDRTPDPTTSSPTEPTPIARLEGCDPDWCTLSPGDGPTGGDLCRCTLPAAHHPVEDHYEGSCFSAGGGAPSVDLALVIDVQADGWSGVSVDTCNETPGDAVIGLFLGEPSEETELACARATGDAGCSRITRTGAPTEALWVVIDERIPGTWWDGQTDRVFDLELFPVACGNGYVEQGEDCDDGNLTPGDGCDASCLEEPPVEQIQDCDPTWCTLFPAGGPNGGDLCRCTIHPNLHPVFSTEEGSCFGGFVGAGLALDFDLEALGYAGYAVDTCQTAPGDSSVAVWDGDPTLGAAEIACDEDSGPNFCAQVGPNGGGPPVPQLAPESGLIHVSVNEYGSQDYWDRVNPRVVDVELFVEGTCGDGVVDFLESCDDGNLVGGDGCDASCQRETATVFDCDPQYCTLSPGAGPNGGDLCACRFSGVEHPTADRLEGSCFGGGSANELVMFFDLAAAGYAGYAVDTCAVTPQDSSLAVFDADPLAGGVELACDEDSGVDYCAQVGANGGGAPIPQTAPLSGEVWIAVDEWDPGVWWDGTTVREVHVELFLAGVCGDGAVDLGEACDDGNLVGGDGCDGSCQLETVVDLVGCDPAFCTLTPGAGPSGGDLCACTFDPASHPTTDTVEGSCFSDYGGSAGNDLVWLLDLGALGYSQLAVDTCQATPGDSAVGVWDADPNAGGIEVACDQDSGTDFCAQVGANAGAPALPIAAPASGEAWVVVDEWAPASWWDGATVRTVEVELLP